MDREVARSRFILPSTFSRVESIKKFPHRFYQNSDSSLVVELDHFYRKEKLGFFNLNDYKFQGSSVRITSENSVGLHDSARLSRYLRGMFKFVISIDPGKTNREEQELLNTTKDYLNFALHLINNEGLVFWRWDRPATPNLSLGRFSSGVCVGLDSSFLSKDSGSKLKQLLEKIFSEWSQTQTKYSDVKELYLTALTAPNENIKGALLVVLLERLFLQEDKAENTYKFSLRITKIFQKDVNFFKKMTKLYGTRSDILHGGKKKFTKEEIIALLDLTQKSLIKYVLKPEDFTQESMTKLLLSY